MISFKVSAKDKVLINQIVGRLFRVGPNLASTHSREHWQMDITAVHANGTPLRLEDLLKASDIELFNELNLIDVNLDRDDNSPTGGKLLNGVVPKFMDKVAFLKAALTEALHEAGDANAQLSTMACEDDTTHALRDAKAASHVLCMLQGKIHIAMKKVGVK